MKYLRIMCNGFSGTGQEVTSMTSIQVTFDDTETNFELAKAKALGHIVQELSRYGLHEALNGIGIEDEYQRTNNLIDAMATIAGERNPAATGSVEVAKEALKRFRAGR